MQTSSLLSLEAQVVGAVLGHPDFFNRAALLQEEAFNDPNYATLWRLIARGVMKGDRKSVV